MRENGHQPVGLPLKTAFAVLQRLNMAPPCPARCALQSLFSGGNGDMNNVETASRNSFKKGVLNYLAVDVFGGPLSSTVLPSGSLM